MFIYESAQLSRPSYIGKLLAVFTLIQFMESQYTVHFTYFQSTDSDVPVSRSQGYIQSGKESHGAGPIRLT